MMPTITRPPERQPIAADKPVTPDLYQVWIDLNFGDEPSDWWWNSPPKPLAWALDEAAECRAADYPTKVLPEGTNPRPDGRWDNP